MLILVGIAPGGFALDLASDGERMRAAQVAVHEIDELLVHAEIIALSSLACFMRGPRVA